MSMPYYARFTSTSMFSVPMAGAVWWMTMSTSPASRAATGLCAAWEGVTGAGATGAGEGATGAGEGATGAGEAAAPASVGGGVWRAGVPSLKVTLDGDADGRGEANRTCFDGRRAIISTTMPTTTIAPTIHRGMPTTLR